MHYFDKNGVEFKPGMTIRIQNRSIFGCKNLRSLFPENAVSFWAIDKIVVHHRKVENSITTQKIENYYNIIGKFEAPSNYTLPTVPNLAEAKTITAALVSLT